MTDTAAAYIQQCAAEGRPIDLAHVADLTGLTGGTLARFIRDVQSDLPKAKATARKATTLSKYDGYEGLALAILSPEPTRVRKGQKATTRDKIGAGVRAFRAKERGGKVTA